VQLIILISIIKTINKTVIKLIRMYIIIKRGIIIKIRRIRKNREREINEVKNRIIEELRYII